MSSTSTPNDSPVHVQPLHNPSQAAHIVVPQAPLGNSTNGLASQAVGMGAKALLAKKLAKNQLTRPKYNFNSNPMFVSPTDNMMTPCTQKINAAKKKHFTKAAKPMPPLFARKEPGSDSESDTPLEQSADSSTAQKVDDDENPF
ncbi:hypothetical protein A0H81_03724 [Grifola frondosa]|uniref:Spo12 family protein n=1 Tax=Grifola frondosa TaxID=5627 RepID=A0A1C7MI40_GRIFR|nr:hypothetical protein A0H81_03724 [Grifola frondosa]